MQIIAQSEGDIYGLDWSRSYMILLSNPAPSEGVHVDLSVPDGNSTIELQEVSVDITPGFVDGYFQVRAADVKKTTHTEIDASASIGGVKASLPVTVQPRITAITDMPASVTGGDNFQGTVNLAGPSDTDTTVELQPSRSLVDVPAQLVIPAGTTSATFTATTSSVDSPTDVTITAGLGNTKVDSTVTLTP